MKSCNKTVRKVEIGARSQVNLEMKLDPKQARVGFNSATLLGHLTLADGDLSDESFSRLTGKSGPVFELPVSATLIANTCQIEEIDEFVYSMSMCSLSKERKSFSGKVLNIQTDGILLGSNLNSIKCTIQQRLSPPLFCQ